MRCGWGTACKNYNMFLMKCLNKYESVCRTLIIRSYRQLLYYEVYEYNI